MKKIIVTIYCLCAFNAVLPAELTKKWIIIGAGPAGIAVVGLLLDLGIEPQDIYWIDEYFNVGRMGQYYATIPGNAKTQMYLDFINACHTFSEFNSPSIDLLKQYELHKECPLSFIIEPLRDITNYLRTKVVAKQQRLLSLSFDNDEWHVGLDNGELIQGYYVVLATGSHPKVLDYDCKQVIPLDDALNKSLLSQSVNEQDTVAVVGSAHSAILLLKFLSETSVGRIINFFKSPLIYAVDLGTFVQNQNAGLKGVTAEWARTVLETNPPVNLIRIFNKEESLKAWLPICTKIIYATGYERNELPAINNAQQICQYDDRSGTIGPRLFGIGIAFPEKYDYPDGNSEYRVGLKFFMEYAQRVIPEWMKRDGRYLAQFDDIFEIQLL